MNFILIAIFLALGMIIFWIVMILVVKRKDVIIEIQEEGKSKIIKTFGKILIEAQPKTKKIVIHNKTKDTITFWSEYFEDIENEKKPRLRLFKDINGFYHPKKSFAEISNNDGYDVVDKSDYKDMMFWHTLETREGDEKYKQKKKFMETALPIIGLIVAGMVFFFSLYYANGIAEKSMGVVKDYELKTLDLRQQEVLVLNQSINILTELKPILLDLTRKNNNQFVGVVNG